MPSMTPTGRKPDPTLGSAARADEGRHQPPAHGAADPGPAPGEAAGGGAAHQRPARRLQRQGVPAGPRPYTAFLDYSHKSHQCLCIRGIVHVQRHGKCWPSTTDRHLTLTLVLPLPGDTWRHLFGAGCSRSHSPAALARALVRSHCDMLLAYWHCSQRFACMGDRTLSVVLGPLANPLSALAFVARRPRRATTRRRRRS